MTFTCHGCGCKADRDIPQPDRDDINIIYFCHACAWGYVEEDDDAGA